MFFSDPLYVTPGGYKVCIRVDSNGCDAGAGYVSNYYKVIMMINYTGPSWELSHMNY